MSQPEALHATKRKRTEDASEPAVATTNPITRSKIWVPFGDMVLQAESTQFRVNRDVLAGQSPVFSDMLSLPQPSNDSEPTIEGCPVVHLFDSAKDWELLLGMLYDPFKYEDALPLDLIASMLRLGRKYEMKTVKQNAVARIRYEYPTRLDSWERVETHTTKILLPEGDGHLNVFKLAYECDVLPSLPILAFLCVNNIDTEALLMDEIQDSKGSCIVLPDYLKVKLAIASERVRQFQRQHFGWLEDGAVIPDTECRVPTKCTSQRQKTFCMLALGDAHLEWPGERRFYALTFWRSEWSDGFCRACGMTAKEAYKSKLPAAWAALPSFFGMPEWKDLEGLN
ncbi:hypothetical protein R3P38DRAFT_3289102 [Favolaschia claudopus]|uniref:BTB domain-containing protein n=1 Tax=Favolaschia claudopus TaxID=2862362 RepID=A0AAV9ZV22_9AGAR